MATSPLYQTGEQAPEINKGHGTGALGPSDSSDSGSDVQGGRSDARDDEFALDGGTNEDATTSGDDAGPDLGDADLDSDTDSRGTGERSSAGREPLTRENNDVLPDHIETIEGARDLDEVSIEDLDRGSDAAIEDIDEETDVVLEELDTDADIEAAREAVFDDEAGVENVGDEREDVSQSPDDVGDEPRTGVRNRNRV